MFLFDNKRPEPPLSIVNVVQLNPEFSATKTLIMINTIIKHAFLILFIAVSLTGFSQAGKIYGKLINLTTDVITNEQERALIGSGTHDDADAITLGLNMTAGANTLYLPAGTYLLKKEVSLFSSGLHIKGAGKGKTIIQWDSTYNGNNAVFQSNGRSNLSFEGITFTGNAKELKAVLEFNSYPNHNKNISVINCEFVNVWAKQAINFGNTAPNQQHSNDNVLIDRCRFYNIYNPAQKVVTNDSDSKCAAIDLQETTLRAEIKNCRFENISGDGIRGWGSVEKPTSKDSNPHYGNWNIHHNYFNLCWMCIELGGQGLGSHLNICHNDVRCSTRNGGYLISASSYYAKIDSNTLYNIDRGLIEFVAIEGEVKDNTGIITTYSSTSGDVPPSVKETRIDCMQVYGFNNLIDNNHITLDRSHPNEHTPNEFNGISIVSKTTTPKEQNLSYKGIDDFTAFWTITNNTITGFTHKAVYANNDKIRNVVIKNNVFKSSSISISSIEVYGYDWEISNNTIDLTGATPAESSHVITKFYLQQDKANTRVSSNKIINGDWDNEHHRYDDKL